MATPEDLKTAVDVSTRGAEQFVELFYKLYDTSRGLLNRFYRPTSAICWNGNPYSGVGPFEDFYNTLPKSTHEVQVFDCHPLLQTLNPQGSFSILVNVNGLVRYDGDSEARAFAQSFILAPDMEKNGNFFVISDNFRFV